MDISYQLKSEEKRRKNAFKPDAPLAFASIRTDHMFLMDFEGGRWKDARIVPYSDLMVPPGAVTLHYGQEISEGAKAFKHADGKLYTFRLNKNAARLNKSAKLLCMPEIPEEMQIKAVNALVDVDKLWYPEEEGATFYIRPFMFGTQDVLGVRPSDRYIFCVIVSASGPYYPGGFTKPVKLLITSKFHRAAPGGTGSAKCGGNYAASIRAGEYAHKLGLGQVLYTDVTNQFVEEAGTMNHFHITKNGEICVPALTDTILDGITTDSVFEICGSLGLKPVRKTIRVDEMLEGIRRGEITEAGGLGTAAVVTSVGAYVLEGGEEVRVGNGEIGKYTKEIYDLLTSIQFGRKAGLEGWVKPVQRPDF